MAPDGKREGAGFLSRNINLYDGKNEILTDYGAARFVNIEQKLGGKYLPETESYSKQTISHNTVVVDEKSNLYYCHHF